MLRSVFTRNLASRSYASSATSPTKAPTDLFIALMVILTWKAQISLNSASWL